jgi:ribosomal protein S18 acetylase RimI-like enzyme
VATVDDVARVRALRLAALRDAPDAFAATFENESQFSPEVWRDRLARIDVVTFVATLSSRNDNSHDVGMLVLADARDDATTAWVYAVWVRPDARGCAVADALLAAALQRAHAAGRTRVRLEVGDHNVAAIALYRRAGFRPTGRRSTLPAPREHITELEMEHA